MAGPQPLVGRARDELLADAAHEKARLVLTRRAPERWETHKSLLLDLAPARHAIVIAFPYDLHNGAGELARGEQIGVSFRHRSRKCMFGAIVLGKRQPRQFGSRSQRSKALLVSWPDQIEQLQRRVYYRVEIHPATPVSVRLWSGGLVAGGPPPDARVIAARLVDLSVGGMRVAVPHAEDPRFLENALVGAEFAPDPCAPPIVLEACFRHAQTLEDGQMSLGFQFIGLELSDQSPSPLARLAQAVSRIQRAQDLRRA